jgi:hypothetical protein
MVQQQIPLLHLHPRTDSNSDMNNPESPFGDNPPIQLVLDVYKKQLEIIEDDFVSQVADNLASNLASQGYSSQAVYEHLAGAFPNMQFIKDSRTANSKVRTLRNCLCWTTRS